MDYVKSFFVSPPARVPTPPQPRLPDLNPHIPDTNTSLEIRNAISETRLVAIISWSSSTYDDLGGAQEAYDQLLMSRERASLDFKYYKSDIETLIREEAAGLDVDGVKGDREEGRKKGERTVRGLLGVHPKAVRESGGLSVYNYGKLVGSLEGEELGEYGIVEKALNAVF